MKEAEITLINRLGLHARAAGKLVNLAKTFGSTIQLTRGEEQVDGKSIMAVMLLAAPVGTRITVRAHGDDEEAALDAITALINDRFGEGE